MPDNLFDQNLISPETPKVPTNEENIKELEEINEKEYLDKVRKKNKKYLIKMDYLERERIARYIKDLYIKRKSDQDLLSDKIDEWDDVYRMKPKTVSGADEDTPNYRTPLSTVTLEVVHANIMNVFFTPADVMRIIPTEAGDISKIKKLDTFGNWSMKNEMNLFEQCDKLFHSSDKNGETPYIVHWVKEHGTEIKKDMLMNPADPSQPLIDDDTKEPLYQEREIAKILYNGPKLERFSRKDYILPENAMMDKLSDWEMRRIRLNADKVNRYCLESKFYDNAFDEIGGWGEEYAQGEASEKDTEGKEIPLGKTEKVFVEFYGKLRIKSIKTDEQGEEQYEELEDEFIATVELNSETLCIVKKNRFPLKMRPIGLDVFMPDDEGRMAGIGIMEFMDGLQSSYDSLHNQYLKATVQANDPFGFFTPTGNMRDEKIKVSHGYLYPTADPKSVNIVKLPAPDQSLRIMMEEVRNFAQLLFGISDYSAGVESQIDPRAPAKKAEIVVAQGNVRLNLIIKRKNKTLKDIFKRWFLLYQDNMPANKFMRIAGEDPNNPWKFEPINMTDFALKSIPDFELTGNVLNANKTLEAQKALAIYDILMTNPFFAPQTREGLQALHALTKWLLDKLDETGISNFLPSIQGERVRTPEEENARFLQGDKGEPEQGEDHIYHLRVHNGMLLDPTLPEEVKKILIKHIAATYEMLKTEVTRRIIMSQMQPQRGGQRGQIPRGEGTPQASTGVFPTGAGMEGFEAGARARL